LKISKILITEVCQEKSFIGDKNELIFKQFSQRLNKTGNILLIFTKFVKAADD